MNKTIIVGAGVGGLVTAAELAKSGMDVTVLEAHIDPGGCAATFFHKGYRFDAGATLAGGFAPDGPLNLIGQRFGIDWQAKPSEAAMQIHLSDGSKITRWNDPARWRQERRLYFGESAEAFWQWQEHTADKLWYLAYQQPPWPPQNISELLNLGITGFRWLKQPPQNNYAEIARDAFRPVSTRLPFQNDRLRQFIDAQLLISAQTTSQNANALFSAAALDLPRLGVAHPKGGMGAIAEELAEVLLGYGGKLHYRQQVTRVRPVKDGQFELLTQRGETYRAKTVILNLPPWNIKDLLGENSPRKLHQLPKQPPDGWGAFMVYAGIPNALIPDDMPLHQQIIAREPLGEGNSIFLSISPSWDAKRAPAGQRAVTISSHTQLKPWWQLHQQNAEAYELRKADYTERILAASEQILPGFSANAKHVMPGTPVTFERFTRRAWGWVGGFPQTSLFRTWGPRLTPGLWLVGDSIFPGQSVPAVALGGLRVARDILATRQSSHRFRLNRRRKMQPVEGIS